MSDEPLSDAEVRSLEAALNRYEPGEVRAALDAVGPVSGARAGGSGPLDFGSVPPGVLVYRNERGVLCLRVTVSAMTGATYDELEMSGHNAVSHGQGPANVAVLKSAR